MFWKSSRQFFEGDCPTDVLPSKQFKKKVHKHKPPRVPARKNAPQAPPTSQVDGSSLQKVFDEINQLKTIMMSYAVILLIFVICLTNLLSDFDYTSFSVYDLAITRIGGAREDA